MASTGSAHFVLIPKLGSGAESSLTAELSAMDVTSSGSLIGKKLVGSIAKMVAALGLGTMIADTISTAFNEYSDYQQLVGGVETLFKESADVVQQYAKNAYMTSGLSANSYMEQATSFSASLLQSLGGDTAEAARYADMAITDMSDNANKMGTSIESIQNAYQGFAKGNFTMLDNLKLGYGGTKEEMERLLADAERLSGIHYDISNLSDIFDAIHVIQGELEITGTTFDEASTTIQGAAAMAKAAWMNLLAGLANPEADLSVLIGNMVDSVVVLLKNAVPAIGSILTQLILKLPDAVIELTPVVLQAVMDLLSTVFSNLMVVLATATYEVLSKVMSFGEELIGSFAEWITGVLESFDVFIGTVVSGVSGFVGDIIGFVAGLWDGVVNYVSSMWENVVGFFAGGVSNAVSTVSGLPGTIMGYFSDAGSWLLDAGRNVIQGLIDGIVGMVGSLWSTITNACSGLVQSAVDALSIHSPSKVFEEIGNFTMEGLAIGIDDKASEAIGAMSDAMDALKNGAVSGIAAATDGRGYGGDTYITINITADSSTTLDSLIAQAKRARLSMAG